MKGDLPLMPEVSNTINRDMVRQRQKKMTELGGKPHGLLTGDTVLVEQAKKNKLTPRYKPEPAKVIGIKGSMVTAESGNKTTTRDGSRFKKIRAEPEETIHQEEDDGDSEDDRQSTEVSNTDGPSRRPEPQREMVTTAEKSRPVRTTAGVPPERLEYYAM